MTALQPTIFYMSWSLAEKTKHSLEEKTWESDPYIKSSEEGSYEESEEEHSDKQ